MEVTVSDLLDCVEIDPGQPPGSVIWMHGLGADAHDFEPIVPLLALKQPLRFVFPNAPVRLLTSMEADIYPKNNPERADKVDGAIGEGSSFHSLHGY